MISCIIVGTTVYGATEEGVSPVVSRRASRTGEKSQREERGKKGSEVTLWGWHETEHKLGEDRGREKVRINSIILLPLFLRRTKRSKRSSSDSGIKTPVIPPLVVHGTNQGIVHYLRMCWKSLRLPKTYHYYPPGVGRDTGRSRDS